MLPLKKDGLKEMTTRSRPLSPDRYPEMDPSFPLISFSQFDEYALVQAERSLFFGYRSQVSEKIAGTASNTARIELPADLIFSPIKLNNIPIHNFIMIRKGRYRRQILADILGVDNHCPLGPSMLYLK